MHSKANAENYREYYRDHAEQARIETRAVLRELKSNPCTDCQQIFPHYVMEFDHPDGRGDRKTIAELTGYGKERLMKEAAQCELVCANCHKIRTHTRAVEQGKRYE